MKTVRNLRIAAAVAATLLAACSSMAAPAHKTAVKTTTAKATFTPASEVSQADTPRAYRADAAKHLYYKNSSRIYKGKLPPLLYAVGVLQVEVDGTGNVQGVQWLRAPNHAPEVMAEIERMVRAAAPFPKPERMGHVTYTDTWLWHKNGRFQLDTLTEGQL